MKIFPVLLTVTLLLVVVLVWLRFRDDEKVALATNSVELAEEGTQPSRDLGLGVGEPGKIDLGKTQHHGAEVAEEDGAVGEEELGTVLTIKSSEDGLPVVGIDVYASSSSSIPLSLKNMLRSTYDLIRDHAEHYRSNEKGEVRIRSLGIVTQVLALDHRYEGTTNISGTPEEFQLLVEPYLTVPVRVVDSSGSPCFDFPVTTRLSITQRGRTQIREVWTGLTRAPDGLVQVPLYNLFKGSKTERVAVALGGRFADVVEEEIDFDHPPQDPVTLVAPDSGSILVKVQAPEGSSLDASTRFAVSIERLIEEGDGIVAGDIGLAPVAMTKMGLARLPSLGLKESYRISLFPEVDCAFQSMSREVEGPKLSGEEVEVIFELPQQPTRCILRGRALDEAGAALAETSLRAASGRRKLNSLSHLVRQIATDKDGYFSLVLDVEDCSRGEEWWLGLEDDSDKNLKLCASRNISGWTAGEQNLGDVVLEPEPLLASGRVIGPDGRPIPKVNLRFSPKGLMIEGFVTPLQPPLLVTDDEGRFCLRGSSEAKEFRVLATCPGYSDLEETFSTGQANLELQMSSRSWFRAQLEIEGNDPSRFEAYVFTLRPEGEEPREFWSQDEAKINRVLDPGRHDFLVYHHSDDKNPVFSKLGLDFPPSGALDIGIVKLGSPGTKVEIDIVTGKENSARRLEGMMRIYAPESKVAITETELTVRDDPIDIFVKQLPFDIELEFQHFRAIRKRITEVKASLELSLGLEVQVEVLGLDELPEGILCDVKLVDRAHTKDFLGGDRRVSVDRPRATFYLPRSGDHDLFVWIGGPAKDYSFFKACINADAPARVSVLDSNSPQVFTFKLKQGDIERALTEIEKQR